MLISSLNPEPLHFWRESTPNDKFQFRTYVVVFSSSFHFFTFSLFYFQKQKPTVSTVEQPNNKTDQEKRIITMSTASRNTRAAAPKAKQAKVTGKENVNVSVTKRLQTELMSLMVRLPS